MQIPLLIIEIIILVGFSAVCSGLNVGLMSLDLGDLRRKAKLGSTPAKRVLPLRRNYHLSLAAMLLTNIAAVSATSLVLEHAMDASPVLGGVMAGILSTLLIVIFGEVLPQALFARHALKYCARMALPLRLMIIFTYPISKPLQLWLDRLFGKARTRLHSRQELGIMISEHLGHKSSELDDDEVEIIRGALQLSEKHVADIMTPISHVYWLPIDDEIDAAKLDEIVVVAFSRIPVFNRKLTKCYGVVLMKDMVDVDFDENPADVDDLPLYPSRLVGSMTALDTLLRRFLSSGSHLLPVERNDKIVGIVTIEDLLEEIVGHEIMDETDRHNKHPVPKHPV